MAFQPGLVDDMRPGGDRPPPAREVTLRQGRRWLSERPRRAEIDRACLIESYGVTTAAIVRVHELNAVRQLAWHYRWLTDALDGRRPIRYHTFNCRQTD